jgi:fumarylacetoacetate (FAA) hydrolase
VRLVTFVSASGDDHVGELRPDRLSPGDVLGSGTLTGGCLLELGALDGKWIEPGDTVTLAAPGLGELRTPVVGS